MSETVAPGWPVTPAETGARLPDVLCAVALGPALCLTAGGRPGGSTERGHVHVLYHGWCYVWSLGDGSTCRLCSRGVLTMRYAGRGEAPEAAEVLLLHSFCALRLTPVGGLPAAMVTAVP